MPTDKTTNSPALVPVDLRLFAVSRQMKNEAEDLFADVVGIAEGRNLVLLSFSSLLFRAWEPLGARRGAK